MTQFTEGSFEEEPDDNYVSSTGDFHTRLSFWMGIGTQDIHPIQAACVFEAGETINLNFLTKEKEKFKDMAVKCKQVLDKCKSDGTISQNEHEKLKKLKHITKEAEDTTVEIVGFPSGKTLWDGCLKCRKIMRTIIRPLTPSGLDETPSGQGLIDDPEDAAGSVVEEI